MSQNKPISKNIGIVLRQAPYGNTLANEALEASLAASVFEQNLSLFFIGDGIFQLLKSQNGGALNQKTLEKQLSAFELYEIENIYVCENSLFERGVNPHHLSIDTSVLEKQKFSQLLHQQDVLLSF